MNLLAHVGVYGGGRMGAGIALGFLISGASVTVIETSEDSASLARDRVAASLAKARNAASWAPTPPRPCGA